MAYALSLLPSLVPIPKHVSNDGNTCWLRNCPVALEATDASIVVWDEEKEVIVKLISLTVAGQVRAVAEIARELEIIVRTFSEAYELGRRRGYGHGCSVGNEG